MQPAPNATVFIVDDDASVREALAWLLRSRHLLSETYAGADEFESMLAAGYTPTQPCCLLLDVRMPGVSGLALFDKLAERGLVEAMPVIFLTGHADVPTAAPSTSARNRSPTTHWSTASNRRWSARARCWPRGARRNGCSRAWASSPTASAT